MSRTSSRRFWPRAESAAPGPVQRRHRRRDHGAPTRRSRSAALAGRDDFEPEFAPARDGEVERTALDTSLAAKELGFKAERDLAAGLEQTISDERDDEP